MTTKESKADVKTDAKINAETREMADKYHAAGLHLDPKTGIATFSEEKAETFYIDHLPEGVTQEHVDKLRDYNTVLGHGGQLALGEVSIPAYKKHAGLTETDLAISLGGKDRMVISTERERTYPGIKDAPATTTHCVTSLKLDIYGTKNRGQTTQVKDHLAALALSTYGKK